jgi:hypothetical protein
MTIRLIVLIALSCGLSGHAVAGGEELFHAPVRLTSQGSELAKGTLYPSPRMHDLDGNGREELLIGDLFGNLKAAHADPAGSQTSWLPPEPLRTVDGEIMKFDNW